MTHRKIEVEEGSCQKHQMVMQSKQHFFFEKAVCTDCTHVVVHTDIPKELLSDDAIEKKGGVI